MSASTTHEPHESQRTNLDRATSDKEGDLRQIREALAGLRFGSVNIIVQDGVIVQIDRTEKRRLPRRDSNNVCTGEPISK